MSPNEHDHLFDRQQPYPLLALITWRPGRDVSVPVVGWCICGLAMVVDDRARVSCVSLAHAESVVVDVPDRIQAMQDDRHAERRQFIHAVKRTLHAL